MKTTWIRWTLALVLTLCAYGATALDTVGAPCSGTACRAADGRTVGGDCVGHYCVAGSAGNGGGLCIGDYCQAGNGGSGGGHCIGTGCTAGAGGNMGGSCVGADCKPGNRGNAAPAAEMPKNMPCCMAWHRLGILDAHDFVKACDVLQSRNKSETKCDYFGRQLRPLTAEPIFAVAPPKLPDPPTSLEAIWEQTRRKPDARCQFNCQTWSPASKSCIGPQMNSCDR